MRSQSRDVTRGEEVAHTVISKTLNHDAKISKAKGTGSKVTMTDMKKRVTAILAFISQTEYELGDSISATAGDATEKLIRGLADGLPMIKVNGDSSTAEANGTASKDFKDLSCKQMIVELTKRLLKWQDEFA